jgi:hypothetical protein
MICCEQCFADDLLKERIQHDGAEGDCEVCGSASVSCIEASELSPDFEGLVDLYEPIEYGTHFHKEFGPDAWEISDTLPTCIEQDGWGVFSDDLSDSQRCDLLDEIRQISRHHDSDDTPSGEAVWTSPEHRFWHVSEEEVWQGFCDHIKYRRRFIHGDAYTDLFVSSPSEWLPSFLREVEKDMDEGTRLFRCRRLDPPDDDAPYPDNKMGAPPREVAASGRANAPGIVVLYAAQERETAIGEMRASVRARITVAELRTMKQLVLADLESMPFIPSPFTPLPSGDFTLRELVVQNRFLRCVNSALSRPVQPHEKETEYVPTQYVAEVVDPDVVEINSVTELVEITAVSCESRTIVPKRHATH